MSFLSSLSYPLIRAPPLRGFQEAVSIGLRARWRLAGTLRLVRFVDYGGGEMALIDNVKELVSDDLGGLVKKSEERGYPCQVRSCVATGHDQDADSGAREKLLGQEPVSGIGREGRPD